ncbi:MAG: hypothetical protein JOY68_03905 [Candidatus Dormibacteraeota bacterium]|nr:hypothetical protein [Candidatus Dormibacteraeota bacterium]MBV8446092.1 hypothetical protein [Candidatus Dormibacteraeota bacterium]
MIPPGMASLVERRGLLLRRRRHGRSLQWVAVCACTLLTCWLVLAAVVFLSH